MGQKSDQTTPDITTEIQAVVSLSPNQRVVMDLRGGWKLAISRIPGSANLEIEHFQPADDGTRKFFVYTTTGNPYGAGKIIQEPDLALYPKPFDNTTPVVGALVLNLEGKISERFSWSNLQLIQKRQVSLLLKGEEFELLISDPQTGEMVSKGWLRALFLSDKNRMAGYVGVFDPVYDHVVGKPVKILEMEDLLLASL